MAQEPTDTDDIARRVKNGEYFEQAKNLYASLYIDPIAERYFFLQVTALALLTMLVLGIAFYNLLPLTTPAPFIYVSRSELDEFPVISPFSKPGETPNAALKRFLVSEYVTRRESYDINTLELNVRFVKAQSAQPVYAQWERELDPSNPESPIALYQRQAVRKIEIVSATPIETGMETVFDATVEGRGEPKKTRMMATVAFHYKDVTVDQGTGEATPLEFTVTDYSVRKIQE